MPTEKVEDVKATLIRLLGDDQISVVGGNQALLSAPSALGEDLLITIEKTSEEFWRGVPVVPVMGAAGSDGSYLRNAGIPTYGHSGLANDVDDVRAHGKDERVGVQAFFEGGEYLYRLVKRLAGGK
jgi:acetylornithine deacetylase/succinyl-diaminopimelate desuccinylase-like protein